MFTDKRRGLIRLVAVSTVAIMSMLPIVTRSSTRAIASPAPTPFPVPDVTSKPTPKPSGSPTNQPDEADKKDSRTEAAKQKDERDHAHEPRRLARRQRPNRQGRKFDKRGKRTPKWVRAYRTAGYYSTAAIDTAALRLGALGWGKKKEETLYVGLPIAGPSTWTDSWGAPRHEYGHHYRRHQGQDLFCERRSPLLAMNPGHIEFDIDELGGKIARLHTRAGHYWYYAHLSGWNTDSFATGDRVRRGDIIGWCGTTGNAVGTPPHLHIGWYTAREAALNPIGLLHERLEATEDRALERLRRVTQARIRRISAFITKRRFGEGLIPEIDGASDDPIAATLRILLRWRTG